MRFVDFPLTFSCNFTQPYSYSAAIRFMTGSFKQNKKTKLKSFCCRTFLNDPELHLPDRLAADGTWQGSFCTHSQQNNPFFVSFNAMSACSTCSSTFVSLGRNQKIHPLCNRTQRCYLFTLSSASLWNILEFMVRANSCLSLPLILEESRFSCSLSKQFY